MGTYLLRRLLAAIPVLFGILIVTFFLARSVPGDPCKGMLGEKATQEMCEQFIQSRGLDQPIPVQFAIYVSNVFHGEFGTSIRYSRPVMQILVERLPATVELSLAAFLLAVVVGVPIGIISANSKNSPVDVASMLGANIGVSIPVFWLGLILAYVFALLLKDTPFWLPPSGRVSVGISQAPFYEVYGLTVTAGTLKFFVFEFLSNLYVLNAILNLDLQSLGDAIRHLILPTVTLAIIPLAIIARVTRASLLDELGLNYILAARAKGLRRFIVIIKHGFRNALMPVASILGLELGGLLSGAVLTETIFSLPGLGRMLFESIVVHDYPVVQGITVVIGMIYLFVNTCLDLSYGLLDPRVRLR